MERDFSGRLWELHAVIAMDVTGVNPTERGIQEEGVQRALFEAVLHSVDEAIMVRGTRLVPGDTIIYANELAAHLLGFESVADLLALPPNQLSGRYEFYDEEGRFIPYDKLPSRLAFEGKSAPPCVVRFRKLPAGDERWAVLKTLAIKGAEQGQPQLVVSIFSDITERRLTEEGLRASEARFQAFMDNSPTVAFIKDEAGRVVFVNRAFEQLFGVTASETVGKDDFQLQPDELAKQFHADDLEVLATGKPKQIHERVPAQDGTISHWITFKFPLTLPSGQRFVAGVSVEITDRVRAEQELERYAERLQALSRRLIEAQEAERRRISRDLHDQVGQALTAIKIDLQVAQHRAASADLTRAPEASNSQGNGGESPHSGVVECLGNSIQMVERTIQQVREFSLDLRPSMLDDLGLPSALLWYAEEQAKRVGFKVELAVEQFPTRLPSELEISCFRVAQEAITNVVRHAQASNVLVQLRSTGHELVLTVSDDGVGFEVHALASKMVASGDGEEPEKDVNPGARASSQGKTRDAAPGTLDGNGRKELGLDKIRTLGLAGMYERVLLVGGSLSIKSTPGAGAIVRAAFPLGDERAKTNDG